MILNQYKDKIQALAEKYDYLNLFDELHEAIENDKAKVVHSRRMGIAVVKPVFLNMNIGLLVWLAISNGKRSIIEYLPWFEQHAKECGFSFIEFRTKRKGFKRLASTIEFKECRQIDGFFVFRKEV